MNQFRAVVLPLLLHLATCLLFTFDVSAQGLNQQDLNAARGVGSLGGMGIGGMGGGAGISGQTGITGLLSPGFMTLPGPNLNEADAGDGKDTESPTNQNKKNPLPPNEFQKYLVAVTGNYYPLYGADFFENTQNLRANLALSPVSDDYVLGAGDQLQIRLWGSTSVDTSVTIDRNGEISLPKVGTLKLAGVKAVEAEGLVKSLFGRYYKDFSLSVSLGKLRKITIYVVGQSRFPGSYSLSSQATLTTGLFASGGPNSNGSIRRVQIKRKGTVAAEFDLYAFLSKGDKTADVKLVDGDVIYFPPASGYMAFIGKVNTPSVYELKDPDDSLGDFLNLAGGLSVVADPRRTTLERLLPGKDLPRHIEEFSLDAQGLKNKLKNYDIVSVSAIIPEMSNAVTLRGNVAQPTRMTWWQGMRISDLITRRTLLISPDSVRKQNEVLFDSFQGERSARYRSRVPIDLVIERNDEQAVKDARAFKEKELSKLHEKSEGLIQSEISAIRDYMDKSLPDPNKSHINGESSPPEEALIDRIGNLLDEVNMDYAVIERIKRDDLRVSLIPFNLGRVLSDPKDADNQLLEPGDVITVFSVKDIRVPQAKLRAFVRVEGEVNKPGVYPVMPGDNLPILLKKAGGITPDAYLYGMGFYREEVKKSQQDNLEKLLRRLESETSGSLAQASQSMGATTDTGSAQAKIQSIEQARRRSLERARSIKPEGRISLGLPATHYNDLELLPGLRLSNGDRIYIPPRPDFVYIYGSVNTESALIYKKNLRVSNYLEIAGISSGADRDGVILIRADGSAYTSQGFWHNEVLGTQVMPGDTIVLPEKLDRESAWSSIVRNTKDWTQIMYQLGLGAAAIKTLRQ